MSIANRRSSKVGAEFWKRLIFGAVHDAKKTHCGVPTDLAILQRIWLDYRPSRECKEEWMGSFECACEMIGRDPAVLREHLRKEIDEALKQAYQRHVQSYLYIRRAQVLACAGVPTAISRQLLLGLVDEESYSDVAEEPLTFDRAALAKAG